MARAPVLLVAALLVGTAGLLALGAPPVDTRDDAMNYLNRYGYMADSSSATADEVKKAICDFQYMANINQTCELDEDTMGMMNMPRCGMPDTGHSLDARRKKRYAIGEAMWSFNDLTYSIDNYTPDIPSRGDVDRTMAEAFKLWSDVSPLTFTRVQRDALADIVISFARGNHEEGSTNPFDGPGRVLAHAFFPENGDAHFDEDEDWTIGTRSGVNLLQVAAHEFGHSLGLDHSSDRDALMAAFYRGYVPNLQLHTDDIQGIRALYGEGVGQPEGPMVPNAAECTGRLDAIAATSAQFTYIFEGDRVWKKGANRDYVEQGYPRPIGDVFPGLPNDIDAAIYLPRIQRTYFFKGSLYWRFINEVPDSGYPRSIANNWYGLPDNLDAAFTWSGNGRAYFVKGTQYYRVSGDVEPFALDMYYPRPLSVWNIPGNQVTAVFQSTNGRTYFFTPEGDYYQFDDYAFAVASGYPRRAAGYWQGCQGALTAVDTTPSGATGLVPRLLFVIASAVMAAVYMYL